LRPNNAADMKTVASVDGKPVSTAAGEPGTGLARREDVDDPAPPSAAGSRISGRVFDEQGRAVPNARVRLGVGGASGGRVNFATTDRSGAFTLHGLRPGRAYTVIAEYQAEDGMMTGRVQANAPDTGVRIALGARDAETEPRGSKILPARVRSSLFPENEADEFPAAVKPRVRDPEDQPEEEPEQPSAEATTYAPRTKRPSGAKLASGGSSHPGAVRAGWTVRQDPTENEGRRPPDGSEIDDGPAGPPPRDDRGVEGDDGENPLPPALEPEGSAPPRTTGRTGFTAAGRDETRVASGQRKTRPRRAAAPPEESLSIADRDAGIDGSAPRPIPDDAFPASREVAPASYARSGAPTDDGTAEAVPRKNTTARRSPRTTRPAPADASETDATPEAGTSRPRSNRRPTWRELSISPDDVPVDEALRRSSADEADDRDQVIRAGGTPTRREAEPLGDEASQEGARPGRLAIADEPPPRRVRPSMIPPKAPKKRNAAPIASRSAEAVCRLDSGRQRIVELRLPGLDGVPVSLVDINADLILLDFWGSWCRECQASIDHHRQLQERLGDKRVQVIGIACEKGATFEARRDAAAAAARKLGINYPVLVTSMDGACPAQKALQVQFYPSMVLLDREGNILQFQQGANDTTLGRIDRAIEKALRDAE
jgi:peroxiredoxin